MILDRAVRARAPWAITAYCLISPLFVAAGGLALSPLLALAGLAAFPGLRQWRHVMKPDPAVWLALAFLVWIAITQFWSPSGPDQLATVVLGALLYGAVLLAAAGMDEGQRRLPRAALIAMLTGTAVLLLVEVVSGGAMTRAVKGLDADEGLVFRNLSRAGSVYVMLVGPVAALAILRAPRGWWIAAALAVAGAPIAASFDILANMIALGLAVVLFLSALRWPAATLTGLGVFIAVSLLFFPFVVAAIEPAGPSFRPSLPLSWDWRLEAWTFSRELIGEKPLTGWGMDAARSFNDTTELDGMIVERIPLHPHSASLQLWLETGVIGVLLAAGAVLGFATATARRLRSQPVMAAGAAAGMAAVAVFASVSYGLWQEWLWAVAFTVALAIVLAGPARPQA